MIRLPKILIERSLADEVIGYEFIRGADEYGIEDIDVGDEYVFIPTRPAHAEEQKSESS